MYCFHVLPRLYSPHYFYFCALNNEVHKMSPMKLKVALALTLAIWQSHLCLPLHERNKFNYVLSNEAKSALHACGSCI